MSWPPGTIVECVDATPPRIHCAVVHGEPLAVGQHYTVRERGHSPMLKCEAVCLVENTISHPEYVHEIPWTANRFRIPLTPEQVQQVAEEFAEVYL